MQPREEVFTFDNDIQAKVIKDPEGEVVDIQINATRDQYNRFLHHFKQKNISWKTSCYTYILQSSLTYYNYGKFSTSHHLSDKDKKIDEFMNTLRLCSEQFVQLEALINNPAPDKNGHENIESLKTSVINCYASVIEILDTQEQTPVLRDFIHQLEMRKITFVNEINSLQEKTATPEEVRLLFSIQDETRSIHSLGSFIADELTLLTECGIQQTYWITDNRFTQLFFTHPAIKALSDAKSQIERRAFALYGARYNNSRDPVPKEMLEVMKSSTGQEEGWFSLMPYLSSNKDFEEVDKMICFLTDKKFNARNTGRDIYTYMALASANIVEVFIYFPLHIALSAASFSIEIVSFQLINMSWLDDFASTAHEKLSLTSLVKRTAQSRYTRNDAKPEDPHSRILSTMISHVENFTNKLISERSGHKLATQFYSILQKAIDDLYMRKTWIDFSVIVSSNKEKNKTVFKQKKAEMDLLLNERSKALIEKLKQHSKEKKYEAENPVKQFQPAIAWRENEVNLSGDYFEEMLTVTADELIDHAFRLSPGVATTWFLASASAWSVLMIPTLSANQKLAWAKVVPNLLSQGFTGNPITGAFSKQIASFLLWKLGYFSSELFIELTHGKPDNFFQSLFQESEKVSLGITMLVLSGMAMQYIPEIPNIKMPDFHFSDPMLEKFAKQALGIPTTTVDVLNTFTEESAICGQGAAPFNFLEYSLLALKFGMLLHSSLISEHERHKVSVEKLSALGELLEKNKVLEQKDMDELRKMLKPIFKEQGFAYDDEALEPFIKAIQTYDPKFQTSVKPVKPDAWTELRDAITLINQMETLTDNPFGKAGSKESIEFYNHLDALFENYNQQLRAKNRFHQLINKQDFLEPFYNKYCYNNGIPLFRLISILPVPPFIVVTYSWRFLKYAFASTDYFSSPATLRQVSKSVNKDMAFVMQVLAAVARPLRAFARVVDYLGRMMIGSVVLPLLTIGPLAEDKKYQAIRSTIALNLHRASFTSMIRPWYAQATRAAGTADRGLACKNKVLLDRLERDRETIFKEGSTKGTSQGDINRLFEYHQDTQKRPIYKRTAPEREGQLAQLSEILHRDDLSVEKKQEKTQAIIKTLPPSSLLRKHMTGLSIKPAANDVPVAQNRTSDKSAK